MHHLIPISNGKRVSTIKDLVPVCSNCHRMIHRNWSKPLEIQYLNDYVNKFGVFARFSK